jgi:hypothetical protein
MVDNNPPKRSVTVQLTTRHPLPPAQGANYFHFTTLGEEVQMLVGTVNLLRVHEATQGEEDAVVSPDITHRFLLSPLGFAHLKAQVDQIASGINPSRIGMGKSK